MPDNSLALFDHVERRIVDTSLITLRDRPLVGPVTGSGERMTRKLRIAAVAVAVLGGVAVPLVPAHAAGVSSITGIAFEDGNRNGVQDVGEAARVGDSVYLFDAAGACLAVQTTDAAGRYTFAGVTDGSYRVEYTPSTWWNIRSDWAPTTTAGLRPVRTVTAPTGPVDFGWRRIVRSTSSAAPISSFTGPEGLRVASYDDVVTARELYDALLRGTIGREASSVSVLFDLGGSSTTTTSIGATNGRYDSYAASSYVTYLSWLDNGDNTLSHEYGHAWSLYYAYLVQQDPTLSGYISARGLAGDSRLGTTYAWNPREMIAEDYRQLFGSSTAAAYSQMNQDVPRAADVPGLRNYLATTFTTAVSTQPPSPSPSTSPSPAGTVSPSPSTSPSPVASPTPTTSPSPTTSPTPSPAPTTSPTPSPSPTATATSKGKGGGGGSCRKPC
jgi:hypothetical protein